MSTSKGSKPDFIAKCKQAPDSDFFHILGAAWKWKNGDGYVVKLNTIPTNWDGSLILTPPKAEDA